MKPTPELIEEWAGSALLDTLDPNVNGFHRFAELATQWGAEQAIKNHVLLNALESAKQHMQNNEPHTLTMHITRKGDALVADALAVTKGVEQAQQTTEPELPEPAYRTTSNSRLMTVPGDVDQSGLVVDVYTATQMHDHFAAGVRVGMGQSQDAKRYRWLRDKARSVDWSRNFNGFVACQPNCRSSADQMDRDIDAAILLEVLR